MLAKAQLIQSIMDLNPSAKSDWLARFDVAELERYLDHLHHATEPRGRKSYWVRDGETPAVVSRRSAA